ncbi:SDR family NAD(P)-dependent oxidoreductase [Nocardioidaceae bacterium]|nr:SDR family NAD(P)-dependent oxidoreductase [Nocardioidaceae bacterium]
MPWSVSDIPDLTGTTSVVTGANGGLGKATTKALAGKGAHVVMAARNQDKAKAARDEVLAAHPDASLEIVELDLGALASVAEAADQVRSTHDRIDHLVLNAGVMAIPESTTADGFESQLGINVLGHWALLSHLLPLVVRTPRARVVTLSSIAAHQGRALDPGDPHMRADYDAWAQYGNTKLAMRHLAQGLQPRLRAHGVDARAVAAHPGLTNSDLQSTTVASGNEGLLAKVSHAGVKVVGMSEDTGALSQLRAATDPDAVGGGLYGPLLGMSGPPVRKPLVRPAEKAIDTLWRVCETETGLALDVRAALES